MNTTNQPEASVIVPVYNDTPGLLKCLKGLAQQAQGSPTFEVLVVDNGSDPPVDVTEHYPFGLKLIRHTRPGSYSARNAGAALASADVLAFIDADCWPERDWLLHGVTALRACEGRCVVGGEVLLARPDTPNAVALYQLATGFGQESNIRDRGFSVTANLFCTRKQLDTIGSFDARLLSGGDLEWCWRARACGFAIQFERRAIVHTPPRTSLRGAVTQARRVAAGRRMLHGLALSHVDRRAIPRRRSMWKSFTWLLTQDGLSWPERLRVLGVATLIAAASAAEAVRLNLGAAAERR